jgi:5-formyltetrahydrofolate cyclo-ligase
MLKKDLRIKYTNLRNHLTTARVESQSIAIANSLLSLPIWDKEFFHIFLPIRSKKEIDTLTILSILQGKDKNVIVPKVNSDFTMISYLLTDSTRFEISALGVPEPINGIKIDPKEIDVVFLPLLAFDKNGNRVGYGKGYYDRFLVDCRNDVLKIGLSIFEAEEIISDTNKDDVRMDYCVTPDKVYSFVAS